MNKRGQSMIEFALIAVLVILGIVIMGPYVLRSVNAHFKLWDEGVQDSFTENITQAPVNAIPNITLDCNCTTSAGECGRSAAGSQCAANQRQYNHTCPPPSTQGCDGEPASSCVNDPTCCSCPVEMGCGNYSLAGGIPAGTPCSSLGISSQCSISGATCVPPPASAPTNCYYGYGIYGYQCGSNNSIQCVEDSHCPQPACLGILSPGAIACPNEPPVSGVLTQNNGISYVAACNNPNPPSNATCQYYCAPPFLLNSTGTSCLDTYIVAPFLGYNTRNDVYFTPLCSPSGTTLTVQSQTPPAQCGNPGTPSTQCTINSTY